MTYDFELSAVVPAAPADVYEAWLSSELHSAMTGGAATIDPVVGGTFVAWDGYITGTTLELEPPRRVVQTWRTQNFVDGDADSRIEVLFTPEGDGTLVTVRHRNVPVGHQGYENGGWAKSYFDPMIAYFAQEAPR
jgi:uncharacterized protein YndB with AHSA1/START domain